MTRLGGTGLAMGSILPRVDAMDPPRVDPNAIRCDICAGLAGEQTSRGPRRVLRFGLEFHAKRQMGRGRHVGKIRLCEACWGRLAA